MDPQIASESADFKTPGRKTLVVGTIGFGMNRRLDTRKMPPLPGVMSSPKDRLESSPQGWGPRWGIRINRNNPERLPSAHEARNHGGCSEISSARMRSVASASSRAPFRAQEPPSSPDVQPIAIGSGLPFLGSAGRDAVPHVGARTFDETGGTVPFTSPGAP